MAGKRVHRSLDDLDSPDLFSTADALRDLSKVAKLRLLEVSQTPGLSIDEISAYLIGKYSFKKFDTLRQAVATVSPIFKTDR